MSRNASLAQKAVKTSGINKLAADASKSRWYLYSTTIYLKYIANTPKSYKDKGWWRPIYPYAKLAWSCGSNFSTDSSKIC